MARDTRKFAYRQHAQAIALAGVLSLCLLPVAVSAQRRGGSARSGSGMAGRAMGSRMMAGRQAGRSFGYGSGSSLFERQALPGFGVNRGYMNAGSMYNRGAMNYNSFLQRTPGIQNQYGARFAQNRGSDYNSGISQTPRSGAYQSTRGVQPSFTPRYNVTYSGGIRSNIGFGHPYGYGNWGRRSLHVYGSWFNNYLPYGYGYYPYYASNYLYGLTCPSPYYYYGTFPPFVDSGQVYNEPPSYDYVPDPSYTPDGQYQGYIPNQGSVPNNTDGGNPNGTPNNGQQQDNTNQQSNSPGQYKVKETKGVDDAAPQDSVLTSAISDITSAWQTGNIQLLSKHIRNDARIAVMLRGKYQYSLDASDYLDMTRDAFRATKTMSFTLNDVKRKESGIYTVSGTHIYQDKGGKNHTVLVTYVLQKMDTDYYITQIGTAPQTLAESQ